MNSSNVSPQAIAPCNTLPKDNVPHEDQGPPPSDDSNLEPLPIDYACDFTEASLVPFLPNVIRALDSNDQDDNLQQQLDAANQKLDEAQEEIQQLKKAQQEDGVRNHQLNDDLKQSRATLEQERTNQASNVQQALEQERTTQQDVLRIYFSHVQDGASLFPRQFEMNANDGSIPNFILQETLGKGSFGRVHRAVRFNNNDKTEELYALKIGSCECPFMTNEGVILKQINHAHVIKCYGSIVDEPMQELGLVLELGSMTVVDAMDNLAKPLDLQDIKEICIGSLKALEHLHSLGIGHLDVKPDNILIMKNGHDIKHTNIKLSDFGFAVQTHDLPVVKLKGTPNYFAPEMALFQPYNAIQADIWSFGVSLLELSFRLPPEWKHAYYLFYDTTDVVKYQFQFILQSIVGSLRTNLDQQGCSASQRNGMDLLKSTLVMNPVERLTASQALQHAWFQE